MIVSIAAAKAAPRAARMSALLLRCQGDVNLSGLFSKVSLSETVASSQSVVPVSVDTVRFLSSGGPSDKDKDESKEETKLTSVEEDPFGVSYQDGNNGDETSGNIGPKDDLPPMYIRDAATGKFTGRVQAELTSAQSSLLGLSALDKDKLLTKRLMETLDAESDEGAELGSLAHAARRIREENTTLNTFGRKVSDLDAIRDTETNDDSHPMSVPLSSDEFETLSKFIAKNDDSEGAKQLLKEAQTDNILPHVARRSTTKVPSDESDASDDTNPDLNLDWLTASAQRSMSGVDEADLEDPFSSLLPSDLNPSKKVNRKRAKPIPKSILHHNNLTLLRRYVTPGGQIMNRVQSRLGAKDQRKIAKLIKRARHLGLIPFIGQWKVENHGDWKEKDILTDKDWEKRLVQRGLVKRNGYIWKKNKEADES